VEKSAFFLAARLDKFMAGRAAPHSVAKPAAFRHAAMGVAGTQHHPMNIHYHLVITNISMENPPILSIFNR
jgi:hypothetical protein